MGFLDHAGNDTTDDVFDAGPEASFGMPASPNVVFDAAPRAPAPDAVADAGSGGTTTEPVDVDTTDDEKSRPNDSEPPAPAPEVRTVAARLIVAGNQPYSGVVNLAVPLAPGLLNDAGHVRVLHQGAELETASRSLARHADGSIRSVQLQFDLELSGEATVDVSIGRAPSSPSKRSLVAVESTLQEPSGTSGPRVWAVLPARWLAASLVAGPHAAQPDVTEALDPWRKLCDYDRFDADAFLQDSGDASLWLYDRATVMYRGYVRRGDLSTLSSAYREAAFYRSTLTGTGSSTRIGVPGKDSDLKYHYAQSLAIHYLLTGDDRFRESAEDVAERVSTLWSNPGYAGGSDFWTERHAGFALLAYVWAMIVSDDQSAELRASADDAVDAYLEVQQSQQSGDDPDARCFAHHADAHGEGYGYFGCSPWMSAILADGLDAYARESAPARRERARESIVKLGRMIATRGLDTSGKPHYWMGVGTDQAEADPYDEHWGESAYVVAMAAHYAGSSGAALAQVATDLVTGLATHGGAPHMRSFNWQCRSAVATSWYLTQ